MAMSSPDMDGLPFGRHRRAGRRVVAVVWASQAQLLNEGSGLEPIHFNWDIPHTTIYN